MKLVEDNTVIGLGSGRTVSYVIEQLGTRVREENLHIRVVPTSVQTEMLCTRNGLTLTNLVESSELDLAIDGADQVDLKTLNLVKGAGGALTREKVVASAAKTFAVVVDQEKTVREGLSKKVPVEIVPFSVGFVMRQITRMRGKPFLRESAGKFGPVVTDNGNYIIDIDFGKMDSPKDLDRRMKMIPGVVETGLFLGLVDVVYVGKRDGTAQTVRRKK